MTRWPEGDQPPVMSFPLGLSMDEVKHRYTLTMWEAYGRRVSKTARALNIPAIAVRKYLHMYDPDPAKPPIRSRMVGESGPGNAHRFNSEKSQAQAKPKASTT